MRCVSLLLCLLLPSIVARAAEQDLPELPKELPAIERMEEPLRVDIGGVGEKTLTIRPYLQAGLEKFIRDRGSPIAAVVVADVRTGEILAMAQGREPEKWEGATHTALHNKFPAASLFKTIVAGAVLELTDITPEDVFSLSGGCATVRPTGVWLQDRIESLRYQMSFKRAYGHSCNGYFAKMAVNQLGLTALVQFAKRFGWDGKPIGDFRTEPSPMNAPKVRNASVHEVGRYAAGFGSVGLSPVHATWITLAIANAGLARPLKIFKDTAPPLQTENSGPTINSDVDVNAISLAAKPLNPQTLISPATAAKIRALMDATVHGGTASYAFRRNPYRKLRDMIGGKTGTLHGFTPQGVTTWFSGMMPLNNPQVVVTSVVVLDRLWHIKGPNLAAEAFRLYDEMLRLEPKDVAKAENH